MSLPVISTSATWPLIDLLQELRQRDRLRTASQLVEKFQIRTADDDEDHPEKQALEGRIQPWPPNRLAFKNITPCDGSVTRKSSATDPPTIHTILPALSTTSGRKSRCFSALSGPPVRPAASCPAAQASGRNRSPGLRDLTASGEVSRSALATTLHLLAPWHPSTSGTAGILISVCCYDPLRPQYDFTRNRQPKLKRVRKRGERLSAQHDDLTLPPRLLPRQAHRGVRRLRLVGQRQQAFDVLESQERLGCRARPTPDERHGYASAGCNALDARRVQLDGLFLLYPRPR